MIPTGSRKLNARGQPDRQVGLPFFVTWAILFVVLPICGDAGHGRGDGPSEEFRGLWVIRHNLTSADRIRQVVDLAKRGNFNALLVQVRGRGDAYYQSRLAPPAEDLGRNPEDFDPLGLILREAHHAGLEVHAWVNVFLTWTPTERLPQSSEHVFRRHPEWFMRSADGIDMGRLRLDGVYLPDRGVEGRYLSPGIPEVRAHLVRAVEELLLGYDIDGVHLDYVRYPNAHYDFNLISRAEFVRRHRFDPLDLAGERGGNDRSDRARQRRVWERWRTEQVSLLVEGVSRTIAKIRPRVKLSAAVKPDFETAYREYGQDWIRWINRQTVDFVIPMFYTGSEDTLVQGIREARKHVKKGHLYAGIGVYKHRSASETEAQLAQARRLGAEGVALFSYDTLVEKPGVLRQLQAGAFRRPAAIPAMPWKRVPGTDSRGQ